MSKEQKQNLTDHLTCKHRFKDHCLNATLLEEDEGTDILKNKYYVLCTNNTVLYSKYKKDLQECIKDFADDAYTVKVLTDEITANQTLFDIYEIIMYRLGQYSTHMLISEIRNDKHSNKLNRFHDIKNHIAV